MKTTLTCDEIVKKLKSLSDPAAAAGMARYGINPEKTLGVSIPKLRSLAKQAGKKHALAQELWDTDIHEARLLASLVDLSAEVDEKQLDRWAADFDSWDVCDGCCNNLFVYTPFAWKKAVRWADRKEEYIRRAGFVMMAVLAVHDKKAPDEKFITLMPLIQKHSLDERNFVRKAVNWALRQIGKRNLALNKVAIETGRRIKQIDSRAARWIASNALAELCSPAVAERLKAKEKR